MCFCKVLKWCVGATNDHGIIMVKTLRKRYNFLRDISNLKNRDRKKFLKECCEKNIHIICEAIHNVLRNTCPSNVCVKRKVTKYSKELKKVADYKSNVALKREILSSPQAGDGIFSIIASSVLPFLVDLIAKKK